jgi:hypothetical protein
MVAEYHNTDAFRGARFTSAIFRDCDLRRIKIADSWLVEVNVSGIIGNVLVNDVNVNVAAFVR